MALAVLAVLLSARVTAGQATTVAVAAAVGLVAYLAPLALVGTSAAVLVVDVTLVEQTAVRLASH